MTGFWIYQSSAYAMVTQGSEYVWISAEYASIYLIYCDLNGNELGKYASIYANID